MHDLFDLCDDYGPLKIIHLHEPSVGLQAVLVVDNVALGPALGGIRMAADVSVAECARLARAMTWKNAAAGIPHGGGKIVVYGDPKIPKPEKQQLLRALAQALRNEDSYIFAPDMGTDEECMAWIRDEVARVVALPRELGGIPLDEIGATGWGLSQVTEVALQYCDFPLRDARLVVQGFGAVGKAVARFLVAKGARLVATADSDGAIYDPDGLDVAELLAWKQAGNRVSDFGAGESLERDELVEVECDIWIPAARPDVIDESNVHALRTRLVVEGANIPITEGAERILHEKGILCVPDFIANAGGVICAAMEYHGASENAAMAAVADKLRDNARLVLEATNTKGMLPRDAARQMAAQRVEKAMALRRFSLFSTADAWV